MRYLPVDDVSIFKEFNNLFNTTNINNTDSLSAIELARNTFYFARMKHVYIIYYFIRENLLKNSINLLHKNTSTILANNLKNLLV